VLRAATAEYRAFFRLPDVARLFAMAVVARMPIGTITLSMLLHVRALTGSFATAGLTVGAYLGASAATAPIVGRWIDRRGARGALVATGIVSPAALFVLWLAQPLALPAFALFACAGVAGAFAPPITVLTRTMWRYRFDDARARRTAFALDAVLVEFAFTAGPALIGLLLAIASPRTAFGVAVVFAAIAVPVFVASPALRYWRHDPHAQRHLLGPLTEWRLIAVYGTMFLLTVGLGLLEIAYPGFAASVSRPPLAGWLIATNSIGSALGGLVYGAMTLALAPERQLRRMLALLALPLALSAIVTSAGVLALIGFLAGLCIAPAFTIATLLISSYAPVRYATEAFTWSATCIVSGIGVGNATGGALLERFSPSVVFLASGGTILVAALVAVLLPASNDGLADETALSK
jgi:MFS family permease